MNGTVEQIAAAPTWLIGWLTIFILAMTIGAYLAYSFLLSRIFKKAHVEPWKAWVPIYQYWLLLKMGDRPGFWAVLLLIPVVNIIANIIIYIAMYRIGIKFGKDGWFVLLAIGVPVLWAGWLAYDKSKWPRNTTNKQKVFVTGGLKD